MKISQTFSVQREQLQEAPNWIDKLLGPLNSLFGQVVLALQSNLTMEDNIVGQIRLLNVTTGATYTSSNTFTSLNVPWAFPNKKTPQIIIVGKVVQPSTQPQQFTTVSIPSWVYTTNGVNGVISIPYIAGLQNNSTYQINIVVL